VLRVWVCNSPIQIPSKVQSNTVRPCLLISKVHTAWLNRRFCETILCHNEPMTMYFKVEWSNFFSFIFFLCFFYRKKWLLNFFNCSISILISECRNRKYSISKYRNWIIGPILDALVGWIVFRKLWKSLTTLFEIPILYLYETTKIRF
jgi:hypothetical protein